MKLIIAGSRNFNNYDMLTCIMYHFQKQGNVVDEIVSGSARGADGLGKIWGLENFKKVTVMNADWEQFGKAAGMIRNGEMADYGDYLIALWDGQSHGTKNMIEQMDKRDKPYDVYYFNRNDFMNVVMVGFTDYSKMDREIQKLIEEKQCFLFNVLVGGTAYNEKVKSLSQQWCENNGAPMVWLFNTNPNKLADDIANRADYVIADLSDDSNKFARNVVMKMRMAGKHGTVVK